jgi:hypothetical protein
MNPHGCNDEPMCIEIPEDGGDWLATKVYWSAVDDGVVIYSTTDSYTSTVLFSPIEVQRVIDALTVSLAWFTQASAATSGTAPAPA